MTTKRYTPNKAVRENAYVQFAVDLLARRVRAEKLTESKDERGRVRLDYDEPK